MTLRGKLRVEMDPGQDARRQSLARARSSMSKSPEAYADTEEDLYHKASPRKKVALQKRKIGSGCVTPSAIIHFNF